MIKNKIKVFIGSDHAGFKLKQKVIKFLSKKKINGQKVDFVDLGNKKYQKNDDYTDYAKKVGIAVAKAEKKKSKNKVKISHTFGILVCGSSQGVAIAANKIKGIRATPIFNPKQAKLAREHNNANVLALSGWETNEKNAQKIIDAFLKTQFSKASRHRRRLNKIKKLEN